MAAKEPLLDGPGKASQTEQLLKYGSLSVMLLGYSVEQVLLKRAATAAYYPSALTTLAGMGGVIVYPCIILAAVYSGKITCAQVKLSPITDVWKPAAVGFGFTLHHLFLNVAAGKKTVPGIWILVLGKSIVPMSMLLNMLPFTMNLRYDGIHWLAMVVLMGGVVLTLIVDLLKQDFNLNEGLYNIFLIVLAQLPMAASFTFIEVTLKGTLKELFTVAFWMYLCIFQAVFSTLMSPLSSALAGHSQSASGTLQDGIFCYVAGQAPEDAPEGTDCKTASVALYITLIFALAMNLAMPVSTRYGGAALMWFVRALSIPLTGLMFASYWIMGDQATTPSITQVLGLLVVACGVLLFNSKEASKRDPTGL